MDKQNQVVVAQPKKQTKWQLVKNAGYVAGVALITAPAYANSDITTIGQGLTTEVNAGKAVVVSLFGLAAAVLALFVGWRYLKRGANSA